MLVFITRTTKYATQHFWRNLWISSITILILSLTLFIVGLVSTLNLVADQAINAVEEKINIDFTFKASTDESDILKAKIYLESLPEVTNVRYISKAEALSSFTETHADDPDIQAALGELDENPLPATLSVQSNDLDNYQVISDAFSASEYNVLVDKKNFSDHQAAITKLSEITKRIYQGGLLISGIFVLISVIMLYNTIRVAIYSHREELGIMKLVGATNWFIRAPFLWEGVLYAVCACTLATVALAITVFSASPYVDSFFAGYNFSLNVFFLSNFWIIVLSQFLISLALALGSSMLSIGRYLKV
ncbi:MAG: permease-like cell division protein FtsX [Patescibacteria group bacterium]|jgi:cell division transport system permease protein